MGKQWLRTVFWLGVWAGVHGLVRHWGMYWYFASAGALGCAFWLLVSRTFALVFLPRPGRVQL